jgi:hypothetical protein
MNKRMGAALGIATALAGGLVATQPASANEVQLEYQLCNSKSGYTVCIEQDSQGWHARAWGPDWIWAALYNHTQKLDSHLTPPGGDNERTRGFPVANIACAGHDIWADDVVCVSPLVKK